MCMKFLRKISQKLSRLWRRRIFLDHASTTPIAPEVDKTMRSHKIVQFANPSALYTEALEAKKLLNGSRERIARILNCRKNDIVFTSGGTEGNNLALLGVFEAQLGHRMSKLGNFAPHFVTTIIEHPSVLEVFKEIERRGGKVTYIPVDEKGMVNPNSIRAALKKNTVLVSVMYANNEIGTIQPIKEISKIIQEYRRKIKRQNSTWPYFHTDSCQVPLYLSVDCLKLGVDMMTLDGIKIYGPRGSGILYVKSGVETMPIVFGGGQEKGLRSGTENIPAFAGFAKALEMADEMRERESERLKIIRDYAITEILKNFPKASLNGSADERLPNNVNICFPGLNAEFAVISLDVLGVCASYSSSCRTLKEDSSSYVVESLGKTECKESSLRFTLGRDSKKGDIDYLIVALKKIIKQNLVEPIPFQSIRIPPQFLETEEGEN